MALEQATINGATEPFGIIGNPVHHSLSPAMHNAAFAALGMNCVYIPLLTSDLHKGVEGVKALGFRGVSVTIPHKEEVVQFVDVLDPVAARIGAVNTLVIGNHEDDADRAVYGYNTDWVGANRALQEKIELKGSRVLLLGAGGSARAIGYGLLEAGAGIVLSNRTVAKGQDLAKQLGCDFCPLDQMGGIQADVLVNTTSVGMTPAEDRTPVDSRLLNNFSVVMDIVYAPLTTRLLREAAIAGCEVIDGLSMLLYQGVAQFELWTGREAPVEIMREVLRERIK
jgi:shikimate dehydrogenase